MNSDLDTALRQLSMAPDHPNLDAAQDAVMARLHARAASGAGLGTAALAAFGAVALGAAAAGPSPAVASSEPLAPFSSGNPLAPSTLLVGRP